MERECGRETREKRVLQNERGSGQIWKIKSKGRERDRRIENRGRKQ